MNLHTTAVSWPQRGNAAMCRTRLRHKNADSALREGRRMSHSIASTARQHRMPGSVFDRRDGDFVPGYHVSQVTCSEHRASIKANKALWCASRVQRRAFPNYVKRADLPVQWCFKAHKGGRDVAKSAALCGHKVQTD
ncbi:hypothetical protein V491_04440 [Pseudogymnoascus sp. VKM F-3775]|nr:hypothetical protein V491_04440 [Pseudogymnoascus sp. VKM F-3775]